ncbi:MAG: hypothetical protein JSR17_09785 [Proteobacteria bacterium]|nr:hypothetical protein [Pseudomonadota bacterium]
MMRDLKLIDLQQIAGGVLCFDGICKVVPQAGIPANYYGTLDNAYNLWLNDAISDEQLDQMLLYVPWNAEEKYIDNMLLVF